MNLDTHEMKTIILASDHAGFAMKEEVKNWLSESGKSFVDLGAEEFDSTDDYPDTIAPAGQVLSKNSNDHVAIIFGGSGYGEAIVMNRFANVRAVVWYGPHAIVDSTEVEGLAGIDGFDIIRTTRRHNDANALSVGSRFTNITDTKKAIELFLTTEFENADRHVRRIAKIETVD